MTLAPPITSLPCLNPAPAWVQWDHDEHGVWPLPDDLDVELNASRGPAWLEEAGHRVRRRLLAYQQPPKVGHIDWESQNIRWTERRLHTVHDFDSVAGRPEATIAGAASAVFSATGAPLTNPSVDESAAFLAAYERARGVRWSGDDRQAAWAAGLWVRAFNARKDASVDTDSPALARLLSEVDERLQLAGA